MKKPYILLAVITSLVFMAFTVKPNKIFFKYPKSEETTFSITTEHFKKFKKEWRGSDYYYSSVKGKDGIMCSVLYYKLNEEEKLMYVDVPKAMLGIKDLDNSPAFPQTYFTKYSNLADLETNKIKWGKPDEDFMFSQSDIKEYNGIKINQKHMYGYAMFRKNLFVSVHLSKVHCKSKDSVTMMNILNSLKK